MDEAIMGLVTEETNGMNSIKTGIQDTSKTRVASIKFIRNLINYSDIHLLNWYLPH